MRRWICRIILGVIALVAFLAVTVQIILWTDLPRKWISRSLSTKTGLDVSARSFSTTWVGNTTLKDVVVRMPAELNPFLTVDRISISHSALARMLVTRSIDVYAFRIDSIALKVCQGKDGRWNIQDILPILAQLRGDSPKKLKQLPRVTIAYATVEIADWTGRTIEFGPFSFHGNHRSLPIWQFQLDCADNVQVAQLALETKNVILKDLVAWSDIKWPDVHLTKFEMPNAKHIIARGKFSLKDKSWSIGFDADNVTIPEIWARPVNVKLTAKGDPCSIDIQDLRVEVDDLTFVTVGLIKLPIYELANTRASVTWSPKSTNNTLGNPNELPSNYGQWQAEADIMGTLRPLNLTAYSTVETRNIHIAKGTIPVLHIPLQAHITASGIKFSSPKSFELLNGTCHLHGRYAYASRTTQLDLRIENIPLTSIGEVVASPVTWQGLAGAELFLKTTAFEMDHIVATGKWHATDINIPPFDAERAEGDFVLKDGIAMLEPIQLNQQQGTATGRIHFRLSQPHLLSIEMETHGWPFSFSKYPFHGQIDGKIAAKLDALKRSANAICELSSKLRFKDKPFGSISFIGDVEGRTVELRQIELNALGGIAQGCGKVSLNNLLKGNIQLGWQDIELRNLCEWWPQLDGLTGKVSGSLTASPSEARRSLEPLLLEVNGQTTGGFRNIKLDNYSATAYLGNQRLLVDKFILQLSAGRIAVRGNVSRHANEFFARLQVDLDQLDLDEIVQSFHPGANKVLGLLSGNSIITMSSDLRWSTAAAELKFTDSDLIGSKIIRTLYNAIGLKSGQQKPTGKGVLKVRAEGVRIEIPSFFFSNRGVETRGAGTIKDISMGLSSPIEGYAVASTRPLKGVTLPGIDELDKLMQILQRDVACVKIEGTLGKPDVVTVPFPKVSAELRGLLWRQLRE